MLKVLSRVFRFGLSGPYEVSSTSFAKVAFFLARLRVIVSFLLLYRGGIEIDISHIFFENHLFDFIYH